jgi:cytidylate kinase
MKSSLTHERRRWRRRRWAGRVFPRGQTLEQRRDVVPVITVSREIGSEGSHIAEKAAQVLGYHFVDKSTMEKILAQYGLVEFHEEYHSQPSFWVRLTERGERRAVMMDMLRRATFALAHHGNVVMLGRGCYGLLGGFADVFNVRVQAPLPSRIARVMAKQHIAEPERAEAIIRETDEVRTSFVKACYGLHLDDAGPFDLVVNTGKVPVEMATRWLIEAVTALEGRRSGDEPTTASIEADPVLAQVVSEVLGCSAIHGLAG